MWWCRFESCKRHRSGSLAKLVPATCVGVCKFLGYTQRENILPVLSARDADGTLIVPARSKSVIQERIAAAKNWTTHPLSELGLGPGPQEPPPIQRQRLRKRS